MHVRGGDAAGRYWKEKVKQTLRCTRVLSASFRTYSDLELTRGYRYAV